MRGELMVLEGSEGFYMETFFFPLRNAARGQHHPASETTHARAPSSNLSI